MASVVNILQYIFPVLMVSIAAILLCFYLYSKRKRSSYDVTAPTGRADGATPVDTVSSPDNQTEVERQYDGLPPRYSTVDHPPPYSLFDPKLTNVWPGGPPPAYELYPITLPLAPHYWRTPTEPS